MNATTMMFAGTALLATLAVSPRGAHGSDGACTAKGKFHVDVAITTPDAQPAAGLKVALRYPAASVSLPGAGEVATVKARVSDLPPGFLASLNDQDGSFSIALASGTTTAKSGKLLGIDFDRCDGTDAPRAEDFTCEIEEAVQDCGAPAGDVQCSVTLR